MSILNPTVAPGVAAANQILGNIRRQYAQLASTGLLGYNLIWNNPNAAPEEVLAALGTNAKEVFELASLNVDTVNAAAAISGVTPPTLPEIPAEYNLSFNTDGSVTLVDAPPVESSSSSSSSSSSESSESSES